MATQDTAGSTGVAYRKLLTNPHVLIISLTSFIGITGTRLPSPVLPGIATAFTVSDAQIGLVMTAFFLPSVVMVPAIGILGDVYGRRNIVLVSLFLFGAGGTSITFATSFEQILIFRGLQGIGFAGLTPFTIVLVGDLFDNAEASAVQGVRVSANSVAGIVIPALAGLLAGLSWNYPFALYAFAFPVFLAALVYLPETGTDSNAELGQLSKYSGELRDELLDSDVRLLLLGGFVVFFFKYALLTYVPLFAVRSLDTSVFVAGLLISIRGVVRTLVAPLSGVVVKSLSRRGALLSSITVGSVGAILIPFSPTLPWLAAGMAVYSVGDGIYSPVLNDGVAALASDERRSGVVSALNLLKQAANTLSPAFFGLVLAATDFVSMFVFAGSIGLSYVVLTYRSLDLE